MSAFIRFAIVGALNTLLDIGCTNLFIFLLQPSSKVALFFISIASSSIATCNSYLMNRSWTFRAEGTKSLRQALLFFLIAGLAMIINASLFLFCLGYVAKKWSLSGFLAINIAKCCGVFSGVGFSFIGYRFAVFSSQKLISFRNTFSFPLDHKTHRLALFLVLLLATCARLLFLFETGLPSPPGMGLSQAALDLVQHLPSQNVQFFSYLQVPFLFIGCNKIAISILCSLLPGIALVAILFIATRNLFGFLPALACALFTALHPRLIEFSVNGEQESLFLLLTTSAAFLASTGHIFAFALLSALSFAIKKEMLFWFYGALCLVFLRQRQPLRTAVAFLLFMTISFCLPTDSLNPISSTFFVPSDYYVNAEQIYGPQGLIYGSGTLEHSSSLRFLSYNGSFLLERLPIAILSPLPLFALLLFVFVRSLPSLSMYIWMLIFPLFYYPFFKVETKNLFLILPPLHLLAGAGLFAFAAYFQTHAKKIFLGILALLLITFFIIATWRAFDLSQEIHLQKALAAWVKTNIPTDEVIVGCGNGNISSTGYLTGRKTLARLWTRDPATLAPFLRKNHAHWLILYSSFLKEKNPELLPYLSKDLPEMKLKATIQSDDRTAAVFSLR
jgi:putative flippase GtrA